MSPMTDRQPVVALVTDAIYPYHRGGKELRTSSWPGGLPGTPTSTYTR